MKRLTLRQTGDTIIEVLLSITILGLVLGGAYALANRNLSSGISAEKRNQALAAAQSQAEFIINAQNTGGSALDKYKNFSGDFCILSDGNPKAKDSNECKTYNDQPYSLTVHYSSNLFTVTAMWTSANSRSDQDKLTLYYKLPGTYAGSGTPVLPSSSPAPSSPPAPAPSPPASGSIVRYGSFESGNLSEYKDTSCHGDQVAVVTTPVREGRYAGKFTGNQSTQCYGETKNVRIHLLGFPTGTNFSLNNGSTFWRAVSLRVPASTPTDYFYAGPEIHQSNPGGCTGPAPLNVGLTGNQWRLIIRGSNDCANNPSASIQHTFGATGVSWAGGVSPTLQRDQWYDFLLGWHMAPDNTGWFEDWVNGPSTGGKSVQIVPRQNMPTSMNLNTNYPMDSFYYPVDIGGTNTIYYDGGAFSTDFSALKAWQNSFSGSW